MAVYPGKIVYAGLLRGFGKLVVIDHGKQAFACCQSCFQCHDHVRDNYGYSRISDKNADEHHNGIDH